MGEHFGFKFIEEQSGIRIFARKTREVDIKARLNTNIGEEKINITGEGDCLHHLIEDIEIFTNKLREYFGI